MNKKTLFILTLAVLALPGLAFGEVTIQTMADAAVTTATYIAGAVVVILWLVTGLMFLTAQGAPEGLGKARKALMYAVAGTVIVLVAGIATTLVGGAFNIN